MKKLAANPVVVLVLAVLLGTGTGLFWFWKGAGALVAASKAARAHAAKPDVPEAPWSFWTLEIEKLAAELKEQKESLKKREEAVVAAEERLAAERLEIAKQRQQIETLRTEISGTLSTVQADEVKNLKALAATYSSLTPKSVLQLFKDMDDTTVVKLLAQMKTDVVSPLFEEMSKQSAADPAMGKRAAVLSEKLRLLRTAPAAVSP